MSGLQWVGFVVAAAVGAPARYVVDAFVQSRTGGRHPWGTFVVNVTGAFLLGLVTGLAAPWRTVLGTAGLGAFTTFSTLSFETVRLAEAGDVAGAATNAIGSVAIGALVAALGMALAG